MKTSFSLAVALSSALLVSASPKKASSVQACTTTIDKEPPFVVDCTFRSHTKTSTTSIDCSGCAYVSTLELGVGLPCQTVTTAPGTTTIVATSCAASATYSPASSSSPPAPTCTTFVGGPPSIDLSPTLTTYKTTKTKTSSVSCGGCALETRNFGPGPARQPTTTTTKKATTVTTYVCATSNY